MADESGAVEKVTPRAAQGGGVEIALDAPVPPPASTQPPSIGAIQQRTGSAGVGGFGPDWFGPLDPLSPIAPPEVAGRQWDTPSGFNLQVQPRAYSPVSFWQLRWLADGYDLLRLLIETRKDQMERQTWNVVPRDPKAKLSGDLLARAKAIETFLHRPDKEHFWGEWLRMILEDLIVLDAPAIYRRRTRAGALYALEPLDGATIKRVIDDWGRTPQPPAAAYQQILKGFPAINYSARDLIYRPRNIRSNQAYGYSPVEQVIMTVNIALRRQMFQLAYYTEGNVPESLIGVPETWTPDQIRAFQDWFDSVLEGNLGARRRARFVPGGVAKGYVATKEADIFAGEGDQWLARVCCYAMGMSPQPFTKMMNRATAGTAQEQAEEEGLAPVMNWVKRLIDEIILVDFGEVDLVFDWHRDEELDQDIASQITTREVESGQITMNEGRSRLGLDPYKSDIFDLPMVKLNTGWEFIDPNDQIKYGKMLRDALGPPPMAETGLPADQSQQGDQPPPEPGPGGSGGGSTPPDKGGGKGSGGKPGGASTAGGQSKQKATPGGATPGVAFVHKASGKAMAAKPSPELARPFVKRATARLKKAVAPVLADAGDDISGQVEAWLAKRDKVAKAASPEGHAGLYVRRNLTPESAGELTAWAEAMGIPNLVPPHEMHVTVVNSPTDLQFPADGGTMTARGGARSLAPLGDKGAVALKFEAPALNERWQEAMNAGATWAYGDSPYAPHVTISYDAGDFDPATVEPYAGDLDFAAESHAPNNPTWAEDKGFRKIAKADQTDGQSPLLTAAEIDALLDSLDLSSLDVIADATVDELGNVAGDAAVRALALMGVKASDDLVERVNDRAVQWARARSAELVGKRVLADGRVIDNPNPEWAISQSTRDMIRATIDTTLADNLGSAALIDALQTSFAFSAERAEMISRTEIANANSQGALESYREAESLGVTVQKAWILGENPCAICEDNEAAGPINLDEDFPSGDDAPAAHPNCECSLVPVVSESDVEQFNADSGDGSV